MVSGDLRDAPNTEEREQNDVDQMLRDGNGFDQKYP
jgi:hypothetical protein